MSTPNQIVLRRLTDNAVVRKSLKNWNNLPRAEKQKYVEITEEEASNLPSSPKQVGSAPAPAEVIILKNKLAEADKGNGDNTGNTTNAGDGKNPPADGGNTNTGSNTKETTLVPESGSPEEAVVNAFNEAVKTTDRANAIKQVAKALGQNWKRVESIVKKFVPANEDQKS